METEIPTPIKRPRASSGGKPPPNLKVVECIREFKLPRSFPSTIKLPPQKNGKKTALNTDGYKIINPAPLDQGQQVLSPILKKLKLKSPEGRDLGEFDVRILPQQNENEESNNSVSMDDGDNNDIQNNISEPKQTMVDNKAIMRPSTSVLKNGNNSHGTAIQYINNPNINQVTLSDTTQNNQIYVVGSDNWQFVNLNDHSYNLTSPINTLNTHIQTGQVVVNSEKEATINGTKSNDVINNPEKLKSRKNSTLSSVRLLNPATKNLKRTQSVVNNEKSIPAIMRRRGPIASMKTYNRIEPNLNENGKANKTTTATETSDYNKNNGDKTENTRHSFPLINSHGRVNLIRRGRKERNGFTTTLCANTNNLVLNEISPNLMKKTIEPISTRSNNNNNNNNDLTQNVIVDKSKIANNLSIVANALNQLDDEEIRNRALQALAECGLGFERFIPTKPPLDQTCIRDTGTQTNVFGIIDRNNDFIRVTGDTDSLVRLQEIERQIIVDDTKITKKITNEELEFTQKLDEMLGSRWVNKNSVEQIKDLLKVDPLVEKAYTLLERDFKNCKIYDKKGLLNIHKAVLKDQERTVKRQITVLRSCKESVDILTEDGRVKTSIFICLLKLIHLCFYL